MATKKLMIAAVSARSFAQAAAACGYEVIALDAFADKDTRRICAQTFKLKFDGNRLDQADFKRLFEQVNLAEIDGFCYGSLFDAAPDLLAWVAHKMVAHRIRLVGNAPEILKQAKDFSFFALLDELNIAHPEVSLTLPKAPEHWLCKQIGGSGGLHIQPTSDVKVGHYFQGKITGTPISMLFVADGKTARTIGFNQQFVAPTDEMPYRFAGAVNNIGLQPSIHEAFEHAAQKLTSALNLCGLNNLDAILDGEKLWILELNPRLSASFDLYENLFEQHLSGCAGRLADFPVQNNQSQKNQSKAQLILYANETLEIATDFVWPNWAADIPYQPHAKIAQDAPICSVFASAENADSATNLVLERAEKLRKMLIQ